MFKLCIQEIIQFKVDVENELRLPSGNRKTRLALKAYSLCTIEGQRMKLRDIACSVVRSMIVMNIWNKVCLKVEEYLLRK